MFEQNARHAVLQARDNAPDIEIHPLFLERISKVEQARKSSIKGTEDKVKDDLMSAYCTLNKTVNLLKKNERLLTRELLERFYPECESLNRLLRELVMTTTPRETDICSAKEKMSTLIESIRSLKCGAPNN